MSQELADIGVIGLAVMGQNLVLNFEDRGYCVAIYNRTEEKTREFLLASGSGRRLIAAFSVEQLLRSLKRPRKVLLMVKAGASIDDLIELCYPNLEAGDILIDGGNSHFRDSNRRVAALKERGLHFVGAGISGGEEGARHGPSLMPGGDATAWPVIAPLLKAIAARAGDGQEPCCEWIGTGGSGHYVKMVHNGIEYGDMQIICEVYDILVRGLGVANDEAARIFTAWNQTELESYLIEITAKVLEHRHADGGFAVDRVLDVAKQKGTGQWAAVDALEMGMPLTLIGEAVFARHLSTLVDLRRELAGIFKSEKKTARPSGVATDQVVEWLRHALYASKIISYAQGFMLMRQAALVQSWQLHFGNIAMVWRGGCIIRSRFLGSIRDAFARDPQLPTLLLDPFFHGALKAAEEGWRRALTFAQSAGIPTPCLSSALAFFDGLSSSRSPANLLQAQRDFFGSHTYERVDRPRGEHYHNLWTGDPKSAESKT